MWLEKRSISSAVHSSTCTLVCKSQSWKSNSRNKGKNLKDQDPQCDRGMKDVVYQVSPRDGNSQQTNGNCNQVSHESCKFYPIPCRLAITVNERCQPCQWEPADGNGNGQQNSRNATPIRLETVISHGQLLLYSLINRGSFGSEVPGIKQGINLGG